jgi:hypothetical protein
MDALGEINTSSLAHTEEENLRGLNNHNARMPLCRLPVELIVQIVRLLQVDHEIKAELYARIIYSAAWTRIMAVCQYLRDVIVASPSLWQLVEYRPRSKWTPLCLDCCAGAPTDLIACTPRVREVHPDSDTILDYAYTHFPQCRAAYFDFQGPHTSAVLSRILEQPAPLLRHLRLRSFKVMSSMLTPMLLGGDWANLQSLILPSLTEVQGNFPPFPALQRLELGTRWIMNSRTTGSFFALLDCASDLQELSLVRGTLNSIPQSHRNKVQSFRRRPVSLPRLRILHIFDYIEHMHTFLQALPTPATNLHLLVYEWTDEAVWLPPGSSYFTGVITRASLFWLEKSGESCLPGGSVVSKRPNVRLSTAPPLHWLRFASPTGSPYDLVFNFRCSIIEKHALLNQVKTLRVVGDRTSPLGPEDTSGATYMTALERVVLDRPGTAAQLESMEAFITDRLRAHVPIREVEVRCPALELAEDGQIRDFIQRLEQRCAIVVTTVDKDSTLRRMDALYN